MKSRYQVYALVACICMALIFVAMVYLSFKVG